MENLSLFDKNYYDIFDLTINFEVDQEKVEKKYLDLMKQYHPDNYHSLDEQLTAANNTIIINDAYSTFRNKNRTLIYFLKQKGFDLSEADIKELVGNDTLLFALENKEDKSLIKARLKEIRKQIIHKIIAGEMLDLDVKKDLAEFEFLFKTFKGK